MGKQEFSLFSNNVVFIQQKNQQHAAICMPCNHIMIIKHVNKRNTTHFHTQSACIKLAEFWDFSPTDGENMRRERSKHVLFRRRNQRNARFFIVCIFMHEGKPLKRDVRINNNSSK